MDTPEPDQGFRDTLYGVTNKSINRRAIIGGALGLFAAPAWASQDYHDPMEAAVQAEMAKIKALRWHGTAHMPFTPKPLDLVVETYVEPFVRAWTDSYRLGETPDRSRRLRVEGERASVLVEDLEQNLPAQQALHEREQYGLYGYLLKTLIREKLIAAQAKPERLFLTRDVHSGLPPVEFRWDVRAQRIGEAAYNVHKPFGDGMLYQQIQFSGEVGSTDLHWPRTIDIAQDGKPYFKLVINSFTIEST